MQWSCTNAQRKTLTIYTCCGHHSGRCRVTCTFFSRPFCAAEGCTRCCGCGLSTAVTKMPHSCCGPSGGFGTRASHACSDREAGLVNVATLIVQTRLRSDCETKSKECRGTCPGVNSAVTFGGALLSTDPREPLLQCCCGVADLCPSGPCAKSLDAQKPRCTSSSAWNAPLCSSTWEEGSSARIAHALDGKPRPRLPTLPTLPASAVLAANRSAAPLCASG